jgi:HlyD family secretion protein
VVLLFDNDELLLKPGMTANVGIVTAEERDVLKVPTAALRFQPPADGDGSAATAGPPARPGAGAATRGDAVWVLEGGTPTRVAVVPGLSDDTMTAVTSPDLEPGDRVITRVSAEPKAEGWSIFPRPGGGGGSRGRR